MKKKFSLRTQMVFILVVFMVSIVGLIYFFQTTLLDDFYKNNKIKEMEKIAHTITSNIENDDLEGILRKQSLSNDACLRIVSSSINIIGYTENNICALGQLNEFQIERMYREIENNNGKKLFDNITFEPYPGNKNSIYIYGATCIENGERVLVLVSSNIMPLQATKDTIIDQLKLIILIVSVATIVLALAISKFLIKPIKQMENESIKLPNGKYDKENVAATSKEIDGLNSALSLANDDITKADRAKKELIANVSHDLKTPLTMIIGYGEMIRDLPGENNEENIDVIIDESKRLSALVDDLLDISKLGSDKVVLKIEEVSLNKMLKSVHRQYSPYCKNKRISFKLKTIDDVKINVDEHRIKQVLYNFINNAINYNDKEKKQIILGVEEVNSKYRVYVYDNGCGIASKDIDNIWDRYFKVDKEHKRSSLGSGIGLSLAKEILKAHNLKYGVESKEYEYSKFYFDIDKNKED